MWENGKVVWLGGCFGVEMDAQRVHCCQFKDNRVASKGQVIF